LLTLKELCVTALATLTDYAEIVAAVALSATLFILTSQTRELARQRRISNAISGQTALYTLIESMRELHLILFHEPELKPYMYENRQLPPSGDLRTRVQLLAGMFGDILDLGLLTTSSLKSTESEEDWRRYCLEMLISSPALAEEVKAHTAWWPKLAALGGMTSTASNTGSVASTRIRFRGRSVK
jgi:hypothetical protein